jgi:putative flippase GtrA
VARTDHLKRGWPRITSEMARFGLVTGLSLGLDLAVAWSLSALFGASLVLCVAAGFLAGASFNYVVHERWTFVAASGRLSLRRWAMYVGAMSFVLGLRLLTILTLELLVPGRVDGTMQALLIASGVSFTVNFLVSKLLIFRPPAA